MKDYLNEFIEKIRNGEKKGKSIEIINSYQIKWAELINGYSYYLIEIKKPQFK